MMQHKLAVTSAGGVEQQKQTSETSKPKQHSQANKRKRGGPKNNSKGKERRNGARAKAQKQHKHKEKPNKEAPGSTKGVGHTEGTPQKGGDE